MNGIKLSPATPDQIEYLERIRAAGEDYDGSAVVGGSRKAIRIEDYKVDEPGRERRRCYFPCPRNPGKECHVLLKPWPVNANTWDWDGNRDAPTLSPSINCNGPGGCLWHGHIVNGQLNPV